MEGPLHFFKACSFQFVVHFNYDSNQLPRSQLAIGGELNMREIFEKTVLENIVGIPLRDCLGFYCINDGEYDHFNCLFTVLHSELRNAQK